MADGDGLHPEGAELDAVADPDLAQVGLGKDAELTQPGLGQPQRQRGSVDRRFEPAEEEGQSPDVVLVSVREEDSEHLAGGVQQVGRIG